MTVATRPAKRLKRRRRVRAKVRGTAERPRISVFRSNRGIFAQLIDDDAGRTLAAVNWTEPELRSLKRMEQANKAGAVLAERAKAASRPSPRAPARPDSPSNLKDRMPAPDRSVSQSGLDLQERVVEINRVA